MSINQRCDECKAKLEPGEIEKWNDIQNILLERVVSLPSELLFGREKDDIDLQMNMITGESFLSSEESVD